MIPGRCGVAWQVEDERQVIAFVEAEGLEIQHSRDEDDAVEVHAVLVLQMGDHAGRAGGAVALASQELRRIPAAEPAHIEPDEVGVGGDVLLDAVKLLGVLARRRPAVAGGDRIDENQVAGIEQGRFIIHEPIGRRHRLAILGEDDSPWTESAQVKPDGGGSRSAVEKEGEGACGRVLDISLGVGREEDGRAGPCHPRP